MTTQEKQQITDYLSGIREYHEGVALYQLHGCNLRLKRLFMTDDTANTREILMEELRKLAGLTESEFARLPRHAASPKLNGISIDAVIVDDPVPVAKNENVKAPEPLKKLISFREKYTFLNSPDCPDVLKVLVADMFTAFDNYKAAHARLQELRDDESAAALADCDKVVTEYLKNREIWEELEYYRENGAILGKAAKFREMEQAEDYSKLSEIDLMKKLQSAAANESKHRKTVNAAKEKGESNERAEAALVRWSATKKALQDEVARRKKK